MPIDVETPTAAHMAPVLYSIDGIRSLGYPRLPHAMDARTLFPPRLHDSRRVRLNSRRKIQAANRDGSVLTGYRHTEYHMPAIFVCLIAPLFWIGEDTESTLQAPAYARVFNRILAHADAQEYRPALALFPQLYAAEIPVDAFYTTLEEKRAEILDAFIAKDPDFHRSCRYLVSRILTQTPWIDAHQIDDAKPIEFRRLLFFLAACDPPVAVSFSAHANAAEVKRIRQWVASPDPWVVSAALFLFGRAPMGIVAPQDIARRWSDRPDLWDAVCTDQALMALASHPATIIASVRDQFPSLDEPMTRLRAVPSDSCALQIVVLDAQDLAPISWSSRATLITLTERKGNADVVKRWPTDDNRAAKYDESLRRDFAVSEVQSVAAGTYKVSVRASMCWGDSLPFEATPGTCIRVFILFQCGV